MIENIIFRHEGKDIIVESDIIAVEPSTFTWMIITV